MTLKQLCKHFNDNQDNKDMCEFYKNQYLIDNKDMYNYEELDEQDVENLRPYLMCWIMALYEYLANYNKVQVKDWFNKYDSITCKLEENDFYRTFSEVYNVFHYDKDEASDLYKSMIHESVYEFKRRSIAMSRLYDIA